MTSNVATKLFELEDNWSDDFSSDEHFEASVMSEVCPPEEVDFLEFSSVSPKLETLEQSETSPP